MTDDTLIFVIRDAVRRLSLVGVVFDAGSELSLLEAIREAMAAQHVTLVHDPAPEGSPG